jgi:hypothetical protein
MKRISILGLAAAFALASAAAPAQDLTAGRTAAQLFSSDCSACHRSPAGLAKDRDARTLAGFLREHYTTKPDTAGALAAYVSGFAGSAPADPPSRPGAAPGRPAAAAPGDRPAGGERRARRESDITAPAEDVRTTARPAEIQPARRRRSTELSGDGEKPSARRREEGDEAPQPPGNLTPAAPAGEGGIREAANARPPRAHGSNTPSGDGVRLQDQSDGAVAPREAPDPLARLRAYATSGLGSEGVAAEAAKARPGKVRRPRDSAMPVPAIPEASEPAADKGGTSAAASAATGAVPTAATGAAPAAGN